MFHKNQPKESCDKYHKRQSLFKKTLVEKKNACKSKSFTSPKRTGKVDK